MNSKHKKTPEAIFAVPVQANIVWTDIESLFVALGAEISAGSGSRRRIKLNDIHAVFHRPHPQNTADKGTVNSVKRFLENAGVRS